MVGQKNQPKTNQKTNQPRQKPTFSWLVADPRRALPRAQDIQLAPFLLFLNGKPKAESIKCGNHNLSYKVINWFIDNCQTGTDFAPPS